MNRDEEHQGLLSIFHYVAGGICALFACFPDIHLLIGLAMVFSPQSMSSNKGTPPPAFLGWVFIGAAAIVILLGWVFAGLTVYAGRCIASRRRRTFCIVIAALNCMFFPFGTALGVFTILVLKRPSVTPLFGEVSQPASGAIRQ